MNVSPSVAEPTPDRARVVFDAVESVQLGVLILSRQGEVLYANRAYLKEVGATALEQVTALPWAKLHAANSPAFLEERVLPGLSAERPWRGAIPVRRLDGQESVLELTITAGEGGLLWQTARPASAAPAHQVVMPREFLSRISHEFRTPLATMNGVLYLLHKEANANPAQPDEKLLRWHHLMRDAAGRMRELADHVLEWNQIEGAAAKQTRRDVPIASLLAACASRANEAAGRERVSTAVASGVPESVGVNEALLRAVLDRYVDNALKFSAPDAPVHLLVTRLGSLVRFAVIDRGRGIPLAEQNQLWQPFFRASNATDRPGSGLGLMVAKRAAELMEARVGAVSQSERGSTFWIEFQP